MTLIFFFQINFSLHERRPGDRPDEPDKQTGLLFNVLFLCPNREQIFVMKGSLWPNTVTCSAIVFNFVCRYLAFTSTTGTNHILHIHRSRAFWESDFKKRNCQSIQTFSFHLSMIEASATLDPMRQSEITLLKLIGKKVLQSSKTFNRQITCLF